MDLGVIRKAGRPRDDSRDAVILEATLEVLGEVGYDRLTIDAVAARARASKATVYRRWPGKTALVVDAMQTINPLAPDGDGAAPHYQWPDTGTLRGDLLAGSRNFMERLNSREGKLLLAVMTAQARDPELARAMRAATYDDKLRSCRTLADRAMARGELSGTAGADTFVEVLPAVMFSRLLVSGEPVDEAFLVHVVDDIALPILGHHARQPNQPQTPDTPTRHPHRPRRAVKNRSTA
jgi:AcrR family transcriptional regulator